jgi:hypothetical protein
MNKEKIQEQINKMKKEIEELQEKLEKEFVKDGLLDVPELEIEVEIEVSYKGKSYNEIMVLPEVQEKIKKGWRLLYTIRPDDYVNEVAFLENNESYPKILKMDGSSTKDDFFVNQMYKRNLNNGYVARFCSGSVWSGLDCFGDPDGSNSDLGVRFCRKKISNVSNKKT